MMLSTRQLQAFGLSIIIFALMVGFYLQYGLGYEPCVLCNIQRISLGMVGSLFLIGVIHQNPRWQKRYCLFAILIIMLGLSAVARQLYIESLPPAEPTMCLPSLSFFWQMGDYFDAFKTLFIGGQDCGQVVWRIFGLSLAAWSGMLLLSILVLTVWAYFGKSR